MSVLFHLAGAIGGMEGVAKGIEAAGTLITAVAELKKLVLELHTVISVIGSLQKTFHEMDSVSKTTVSIIN